MRARVRPAGAAADRPYSPEDVRRLRGSVPVEHSLARRGANRLWELLRTEDHVNALGAATGNQAMQIGGEYEGPDFRALIPGTEIMAGPYDDERRARTEWTRLSCCPERSGCATVRYSIAAERSH